MRMTIDVPTYPTKNTYIEGTFPYGPYINRSIDVPTYPHKNVPRIKLCYLPR